MPTGHCEKSGPPQDGSTSPALLPAIPEPTETPESTEKATEASQPKADATNEAMESLAQLSCSSGEHFRVSADHFLEAAGNLTIPLYDQHGHKFDSYQAWIRELESNLSQDGKKILDWEPFDHLRQVYNCAAAHTHTFGKEVNHTRRDHCIHAASLARELGKNPNLGLTQNELQVLETVMLLHDMHRLGSHALDNVFSSFPGAPKIKNWGWGHDFHDYHGAAFIAKDPEIRERCGKHFADVLAVLAHQDKRDPSDPSRIADFGTVTPTLSAERVKLLYQVKEELDRISCRILDYMRSGFSQPYKDTAVSLAQRYTQAMRIINGSVCFEESINVVHLFVGARQLSYEHYATHPASCLVDAVLNDAVWSAVQNKFSGSLFSKECYEYVRDATLAGEYEKLFGQDVLTMLDAPRADQRALGLEDMYAPLFELSIQDLSEREGLLAIRDTVPPHSSERVCGFPRCNMTNFEYRIRQALIREGHQESISVIISNDCEKTFPIQVTDARAQVQKFTVAGVRSSQGARKIIIAAKALDQNGECINLKSVHDSLYRFLTTGSQLLKDPSAVKPYNKPRAFCEPFKPEVFEEGVRKNMRSFVPAWMSRGGCGLVSPSTRAM